MVKNYAVIKKSVVTNVIALDSKNAHSWKHDGDKLVESSVAGPGDTYSRGKFTKRVIVEDYRKQRKAEYPDFGDQLDMQYHDNVDGTTTWADAIAAVKNKYPKP